MTNEEFYGEEYRSMKAAERQLLEEIARYGGYEEQKRCRKVIEYCRSRIKSPESMTEKLRKRGLPVTREAALTKVHDAVGIRVICPFFDDIYRTAEWLKGRKDFEILEVKDYIAHPKESGYRSYHIILRLKDGPGQGVTAEVQIRTIALDFWASLEHRLKYKRSVDSGDLICRELKRCADEIASLDLAMQTIKDMISEDISGRNARRRSKYDAVALRPAELRLAEPRGVELRSAGAVRQRNNTSSFNRRDARCFNPQAPSVSGTD